MLFVYSVILFSRDRGKYPGFDGVTALNGKQTSDHGSVRRPMRRGNQFDALPGSYHWRILHLLTDGSLQKEVGESSDTVQKYREHE